MSKDKYISMVFPIQCKGRNTLIEEVLSKPVAVKVRVYQSPGNEKDISTQVECPYNVGAHGQKCKASHPDTDKVGEWGVGCPFSLDIPYTLDTLAKRRQTD